MLHKNDNIMLMRDMHGLKEGTIFRVEEVNTDGLITFSNELIGVGAMSYDEFESNFNIVDDSQDDTYERDCVYDFINYLIGAQKARERR